MSLDAFIGSIVNPIVIEREADDNRRDETFLVSLLFTQGVVMMPMDIEQVKCGQMTRRLLDRDQARSDRCDIHMFAWPDLFGLAMALVNEKLDDFFANEPSVTSIDPQEPLLLRNFLESERQYAQYENNLASKPPPPPPLSAQRERRAVPLSQWQRYALFFEAIGLEVGQLAAYAKPAPALFVVDFAMRQKLVLQFVIVRLLDLPPQLASLNSFISLVECTTRIAAVSDEEFAALPADTSAGAVLSALAESTMPYGPLLYRIGEPLNERCPHRIISILQSSPSNGETVVFESVAFTVAGGGDSSVRTKQQQQQQRHQQQKTRNARWAIVEPVHAPGATVFSSSKSQIELRLLNNQRTMLQCLNEIESSNIFELAQSDFNSAARVYVQSGQCLCLPQFNTADDVMRMVRRDIDPFAKAEFVVAFIGAVAQAKRLFLMVVTAEGGERGTKDSWYFDGNTLNSGGRYFIVEPDSPLFISQIHQRIGLEIDRVDMPIYSRSTERPRSGNSTSASSVSAMRSLPQPSLPPPLAPIFPRLDSAQKRDAGGVAAAAIRKQDQITAPSQSDFAVDAPYKRARTLTKDSDFSVAPTSAVPLPPPPKTASLEGALPSLTASTTLLIDDNLLANSSSSLLDPFQLLPAQPTQQQLLLQQQRQHQRVAAELFAQQKEISEKMKGLIARIKTEVTTPPVDVKLSANWLTIQTYASDTGITAGVQRCQATLLEMMFGFDNFEVDLGSTLCRVPHINRPGGPRFRADFFAVVQTISSVFPQVEGPVFWKLVSCVMHFFPMLGYSAFEPDSTSRAYARIKSEKAATGQMMRDFLFPGEMYRRVPVADVQSWLLHQCLLCQVSPALFDGPAVAAAIRGEPMIHLLRCRTRKDVELLLPTFMEAEKITPEVLLVITAFLTRQQTKK